MTSSNATPRLDALLSRLRRGLSRQVLAHGLGTIGLVGGAWLAYIYWADRVMHLPKPIRVFHGVLLLALPAFFAVRSLLRPLRRIPDAEGLALLAGRARPDTHDLLVSALQLAPRAPGSTARELIERVVTQAEAAADSVPTEAILDPRGPRRRLAFGATALLVAAGSLLASPSLAGIFLSRMVGRDVSWPQRTHLEVEIPSVGDRLHVESTPEEILVLAARGTDVPVHVRAQGEVPREVVLHFDGGHETSLAAGGTPLFRTLLRSVQEDLTFHVTGGDDQTGRPRVRVQVLMPPDVAGVAWRVEPPAYSGLPEVLAHSPDIEVLAGSRVRVHLLPDPADAAGTARLFPADVEVALEPAPFPPVDGDEAPGGAPTGLAFEMVAEMSTRIRFDLQDDRGLRNPDPGLFGMTVVEDRRPEVLLLSPARAEMDVVLGGAVPLRARVEDDFGLASLAWDVRSEATPDEPLLAGELSARPLNADELRFQSSARDARLGATRLEVADLGSKGISEGSVLVLQVVAVDNREPQGNETLSAPVRLRVVSAEEFLRHLQDGLARASDQANALSQLSARQLASLRLSLEAASAEAAAASSETEDLAGLVNGGRRVEGDARALGRELASLAEGTLYNRIDERGGPLLEALDQGLSGGVDRSFRPEPWRELHRRYSAGELGQAEVAATLVRVVGLALEVSEEHARASAEATAEANDTQDPSATRVALERAVVAQERAQQVLDELVVRLGEWDNFQSVLTLTRDILTRQKNLRDRTNKYAEDH